MRNLSFLLLFLSLIFLSHPGEARALRVALLLESQHESASYNLLKQGLAEASKKTSAQTNIIVTGTDTEKQTAIFRQAAKDYDLVIVTEARLHEVLRNNAGSFPLVKFGCIDTGVRARNIMSVTFADEPACFLAGAAASMASKTNVLAWIMDDKSPMQDTMLAAFIEGAKIQKNSAKVLIRETGFEKPRAVSSALRDLAAEKADWVVVAAGTSSKGAYIAAGTTKAQLISMDDDLSSLAPKQVGLSIIKRFDLAIQEIVLSAASSSFKAKEIVVYDLQNQGVAVKISKSLRSLFPAHLEKRLEELKKEIQAERIHLQDLRNPTLCNCL